MFFAVCMSVWGRPVRRKPKPKFIVTLTKMSIIELDDNMAPVGEWFDIPVREVTLS